MGIVKKIWIENDPAYEAERQRGYEEVSEFLKPFTERLQLTKFCKIEGKRRLDRTWEMAVGQSLNELEIESVTIDGGQFFKSVEDRKAVKALAEEKHPDLFKNYGLRPPKRCPACNRTMRKRLARKGASAGRPFWGCSGYPACRHTEDASSE